MTTSGTTKKDEGIDIEVGNKLFAFALLYKKITMDGSKYMEGLRFPNIEGLKSLKGKNLACFCPLDKPCHADVLLKIANK